jgi:hypothetical protein
MDPDLEPRPAPQPEGTTFHLEVARLTVMGDYTTRHEAPTAPPSPFPAQRKPPPFTFEHDRERRVFRLTWRDGQIEVFRDNADWRQLEFPGDDN